MTDLMAMLEPAPGLFSMMKDWPMLLDKAWPTARATASTAPPAE